MKAQQLNFMPAKPGLSGIAKQIKQGVVIAITFFFSYTAVWAQSSGGFAINLPIDNNKITNDKFIIAIKLDMPQIKDLNPESITLKTDDTEREVTISSIKVDGDYLKLEIEPSSYFSTLTGGLPIKKNPRPIISNKTSLKLTYKEITIDNVSGVVVHGDTQEGFMIKYHIDYANSATPVTDNTSYAVRTITNTDGNNNDNNARNVEDNIITKDEVQGYINAYPNPASDNIKLRSINPKLTINEVTLINAIGAKLTTVRPEDDGRQMQISISTYPSGVYFLQIKTNSGDAVKRIVIVN